MRSDRRSRAMRSNTALSLFTRQGGNNRLLAWAVSGAVAFMHGRNADKPPKLRFIMSLANISLDALSTQVRKTLCVKSLCSPGMNLVPVFPM